MKITAKERKIFNNQFKAHLDELKVDLIEWQLAQLEVLDDRDMTCQLDFKAFALESLLHRLKSWHEVNYAALRIMEQTNDILEDFDEDD